jgi:hypothetical protein
LGEANLLLLFGEEFMVLLLCEEESSLFLLKKMFGRPVIVCAVPQNRSLLSFLVFLLIARHMPVKRAMQSSKEHTLRAMKESAP